MQRRRPIGVMATILVLFAAQDAFAVTAKDEATPAGIAQHTTSWSANPEDYNGDGWTDLLIVRHWKATAQLWTNNKNGTFSLSPQVFPLIDRHDCAWGDVNGDALKDIFCSIGAVEGTGVGANELWIQGASGTFTNQAAAYGVTDPYGRGRWSTFIDFNKDGFSDLFLGNQYPRTDGRRSPNRFYVNVGGKQYTELTIPGLSGEYGSTCAWAVNFNNDAWQDLLVCGQTGPHLYRNEGGGTFTDRATALGLTGVWEDARLIDLNGDAWRDVLELTRTAFRTRLRLQPAANGFAAPVTHRVLTAGRSFATGDVNRDGLTDVYIVQTGSAPDVMLLGAAGGSFVEMAIPQAASGAGDHAAGMDYDGDGYRDFVVLNGAGPTPGPVQLISFGP